MSHFVNVRYFWYSVCTEWLSLEDFVNVDTALSSNLKQMQLQNFNRNHNIGNMFHNAYSDFVVTDKIMNWFASRKLALDETHACGEQFNSASSQ